MNSNPPNFHRRMQPSSQSVELDISCTKAAPSPATSKRFGKPFINYELFVWVIYGTFTTLAIVDRFTWNIWPREMYHIGSGTAGSDFVDGLKEGPWAVKAYDAIARISGRYSIVALNLLTFTMSHTTFAWLSETWLARHIFDMRDYVAANRRLHKWNGIGIVVMTLLHVWSIIFPCIFHGWHAQVVLGSFEWILSERGPPDFKDINTDTRTMSLQGDDAFRIVEMTILLAILLPLSVRWLSTRWHLGVQLHSTINVLYFIDIVRRHTHPHSWILNTPFFFAWILDLVLGVYWRRENPIIFRKHLSRDYMLLFWDQKRSSYTVGPKYFLKLVESSTLERAHVFTGFENRRGLDLADGRAWSTCLLVRIYHSKRRPRLGKIDKVSHTTRIAEATDLDIWTWGPFLGSMSEAVRTSMECGSRSRGVTLVAGGSAAGYVIDAVQQHCGRMSSTQLTVLYTARDVELFEWVIGVLSKLVDSGETMNLTAVVAVTDGGEENEDVRGVVARWEGLLTRSERGREVETSSRSSSERLGSSESRLVVRYGRLNFAKLIPEKDVVYFQGSGGLQKAVEIGAKAKKARMVAGPAYDNDSSRKEGLLRKLGLGCLQSKGEAV